MVPSLLGKDSNNTASTQPSLFGGREKAGGLRKTSSNSFLFGDDAAPSDATSDADDTAYGAQDTGSSQIHGTEYMVSAGGYYQDAMADSTVSNMPGSGKMEGMQGMSSATQAFAPVPAHASNPWAISADAINTGNEQQGDDQDDMREPLRGVAPTDADNALANPWS